MRILQEGDVGSAFSETRGMLTDIEYRYQNITLEKTGVTVTDILVGIDPSSGEILTIPAQSIPRISATRHEAKNHSFNVRLPVHLMDVAALIADRFHTPTKQLQPALIRYYIGMAHSDTRIAQRLVKLAGQPWISQGPLRAFSFRAGANFLQMKKDLLSKEPALSETKLLRATIAMAKADVLDNESKTRTREIAAIASAI